jgi:hypothetical protein
MFVAGAMLSYWFFVYHHRGSWPVEMYPGYRPKPKKHGRPVTKKFRPGNPLLHKQSAKCMNARDSWTWMGDCDKTRWELKENGTLRDTQTGSCFTGSGAMGECVPGTWKHREDGGLWTSDQKCLVSRGDRPGIDTCSQSRYDRWFL